MIKRQEVYDLYWYFAYERQNIFLKKLNGGEAPWTEDSFTVVGPGSLRGIKKCFISKEKMSNEDIIRYMYEHQEEEFKRLGLDFKKTANRKLQLIDCQGLFCEIDKYTRAKYPELKSNRVRIKKKYIPKKEKIIYVYPKKWKVEPKKQ